MSMSTSGGRHTRSTAPLDARPAVLVAFVAAFEFAAAWMATSSVMMAAAVILGAAALVACVLAPSVMLVATFPASFATWRVSPAAVDLSVADLLTVFGVMAAFPSVPWRSRAFRKVLLATLAYSGAVSLSVIVNPSFSGAVEVGHRFTMVVGTVCIGAAVVNRGKVTAALRALVIAACTVSIAAVVDSLTHDLEPAYAFGLQKNSIGTLVVSSLLCVYFGRKHLRWPTWLVVAAGLVMAAGLAASQSRGSGVALIAVFLVFLIRSAWVRETRRVWRIVPLVLLLGSGVGTAMVLSFQQQATKESGIEYKFTSAGSREVTYTTVWSEVILPSPVFGAGPKWFNKPGAPATEPHNVFIDELSSDGVVGLVALVVLLWVCLGVARGAGPPLGELAWYVLLARIIASSFDIFWVAGPNTLPFLVLGLAVGAAAAEEARRSHQVPVGRTEPVGVS